MLNGTKRFITGGGIADITVVFARESDSEGWRDVSAFVVPKEAEGFSQIKMWDKMGIRASHTADLAFDDVRIPLENRLGDPDPDFRSGGRGALGTLAATRPWIGAFAVGLARASFEYAADYARERKTMKRPLIEHQGVGFMLADMDIAIDAARLLTWRAGEMAASNQPFDLEEASKAKTFASDMAMKVTTDAVQVCGRSRLHARTPPRKVDARRQDLPNLRRSQPDPTNGHRPQHPKPLLRLGSVHITARSADQRAIPAPSPPLAGGEGARQRGVSPLHRRGNLSQRFYPIWEQALKRPCPGQDRPHDHRQKSRAQQQLE